MDMKLNLKGKKMDTQKIKFQYATRDYRRSSATDVLYDYDDSICIETQERDLAELVRKFRFFLLAVGYTPESVDQYITAYEG